VSWGTPPDSNQIWSSDREPLEGDTPGASRQSGDDTLIDVAARDIALILKSLWEARVRYVVVGGVAVVLHGYLRLTADLDLVVALERDNVLAAVEALAALGYRPRPPRRGPQFDDPEIRSSWARDKDMKVFSLRSPSYPGVDVDLFVEEPVPFDDLRERARVADLYGVAVPIAGIPDLIAMKRTAGRPEDLLDIAALERIALSLKRDGQS
jgi:hypothetical protein